MDALLIAASGPACLLFFALIRKINTLSTLHIERGLVRFEFEPQRKTTKKPTKPKAPKALKPPQEPKSVKKLER